MSDPYATIAKADPYASVGAAAPAPASAPAPTTAQAVANRDNPSFWENLVAPAKNAWSALQTDIGRVAKSPPPSMIPGVSERDRALGSVAQDIAGVVTSPIAGPVNALVVQPGANLLDQIPAPPDVKGGHPERRLTPEEWHAQNENTINTALLALGPKGLKGGATAEAMTSRYASKVASVVNKVPAEVALDESGALTEEGREAAARAGVHPEDVQTGYKAVQEAQAAPPAPEAAPAAQEAAAPPQADAEPVQAAPPVEPQGPLETPPGATPDAPPETTPAAEPPPAAPPPEGPLPASATDRLAQAQSEGVDLTRGQAAQDFNTQQAEEQLRATAGPEGTAARQFFAKQQQQIAGAVDRFKAAFGDPEATAVERGQMVKDALTDLRDQGKAGVKALYDQARDLAEKAGGDNSNLIHLDTGKILQRMREIFIDDGVDEGVRRALKQQAAKYGLIGENPKTVEGETTVQLRDNTGEPAGKVTFTGPPQSLTILNAEDLRQFVNSQFQKDHTAALQSLKPLIDDALQGAVERAATEGEGDVGRAFQDARQGHAQQQRTFKAKDTVQKLIDWKRGTQTPVVLPENAIREIFKGGKEAATELKKVKAILLSKPTPKSKAAWQAIQAHAIADIFEKAMVLNARMEGGELSTISGAKLNTAIQKFGADKLKILLPEADFNQLMKLRRIVGDATIPIERVANHSGSGWATIRFLAGQGVKLAATAAGHIPIVGDLGHAAHGLARISKEAGAASATLKGIEGFDEAAAAKVDNPPKAADYARKFISVAGSDAVLSSLVAGAANENPDAPTPASATGR